MVSMVPMVPPKNGCYEGIRNPGTFMMSESKIFVRSGVLSVKAKKLFLAIGTQIRLFYNQNPWDPTQITAVSIRH